MLARLKQLGAESLIYGISGIVTKFLGVLLVPIYTRIFAPADYGITSLVTSTMAVVSIFVVLALDNSAHRWFWDSDEDKSRKTTISSWAWCQISVSLLFATAIFFASDWLAKTIVERDDAGVYFRLAAGALPASVFGTVVSNWLRMRRRPIATVTFAFGTSLLNIALVFVLVVVIRRGVEGVFVAQLITAVTSGMIALVMLRDWVNPIYFDLKRLWEMLRFSLPLIPAAAAYWVLNFSDRYFVQFFTSTSEVGLYQVGAAIASGVALLTGAFQQAWGPFAFSIHKQEQAREIFADVLIVYLLLTSAAATALAIFAPEIIAVLATKQYVGACPVVGLLAFSCVMTGLGTVASTGPSIAKKSSPIGLAIAGGALLNIGLNFALVPLLGKTGSAVATLASQSVVPIYLFYRSQRIYPIPYRFGAGLVIVVVASTIIGIGTHLEFGDVIVAVAIKLVLLLAFVPLVFAFHVIDIAQVAQVLRSRSSTRG